MERKARPWTEEYYDLAEFFFWSPDKIGHVSHSKVAKLLRPFGVKTSTGPSAAEVIARLRRIEEPLNHVLGVFFALASEEVVARVFERALNHRFHGPFHLLGAAGWRELKLDGATQPDFCFHADNALLMVEVKVKGGKSQLEQVVKYGLLAAQAKKLLGVERCALCYLTPYELPGIFQEKFSGWEAVRREAISHIGNVSKEAFLKMGVERHEALTGALNSLSFANITFQQFDTVLSLYLSADVGEVERRLVYGIREELRARELVS